MKLGLFGNTLSHWNEFDEIANQMFKQFCTPVGMNTRRPNWNVTTTEKGWNVEIEMPGLTKEDISIELKNNSILISEIKDEESETRYENLRYALPKTADKESISAKMENGILNLSVFKTEIENDTRTIDID